MEYSNALYHLIRQRAGTKMLRQAESMLMYDQASDYLDESHLGHAMEIFNKFEADYPPFPETPMGFISLSEIEAMDENDLKTLPWIYVFMLQSLTGHEPIATNLLSQKLAASPAAAWRIPLQEGIAPADAFKHTYDEWLYVNPWIESFAVWVNADPTYDTEDPVCI